MPVTTIAKDPEARTLTITTELDHPIERAWELWADARKLERWWGPPTYPATFEEHDLSPGGRVTYFMTGPGGDRPRGWWRVRSVAAPHHLEFDDGFADADGRPDPDMPTMVLRVELVELPGGRTSMTIETTFPSTEAMERILDLGMEEGLAAAMDQMDAAC